ncbi:MAG: DUF6152 family protein [Candidatus Entotheonellia bacterium]
MLAKRHVAIAIALAMAAVAVDLAFGHHGWSGYDSGQVLNLTGVIQESGYEHPHAYVKMQVRDKLWLVVLAPPSRMERRGVPRETLAAGTTVTVVGYPHRSDDGEMRAERITLNGKTAELR